MAPKIVLTADRTLTSDFHHLPNAPFYACGPSDPKWAKILNYMVRKVFDSLARPPQIREGGILVRAPYGLRKVQAALEPAYGENEVVAVDPDHLHNFVDENTAVVAAATMNPLGLNPLTQILQYFGGSESFAVREFRKVMAHISSLRQRLNLKFRTVVGGPGAAEFWYLPRDLSSLLMR